MAGFDPTAETFATEERVEVDDVPGTARVTVQAGGVVGVSFFVEAGHTLKPTKVKDIEFSKLARRAMKEAPDDVQSVGQEED